MLLLLIIITNSCHPSFVNIVNSVKIDQNILLKFNLHSFQLLSTTYRREELLIVTHDRREELLIVTHDRREELLIVTHDRREELLIVTHDRREELLIVTHDRQEELFLVTLTVGQLRSSIGKTK